MFREKLLVPALLSLLALAACGRSTVVYPDPPIQTDQFLPTGLFDQSVNQASVTMTADPSHSGYFAVQMQTQSGSNAAGSFNGSGTGNRALLGISATPQMPLSTLQSITFDAKYTEGHQLASVLLEVDLNCDGSEPYLFVADADLLSSQTQSSGFNRTQAALTDSVWNVSGTEITEPGNSSQVLVPALGTTPQSLTAFLASYPGACLGTATSYDEGLPKNFPTAAVMISLGDENTTTANTALINRITVGTDVLGDWQ